MWCNIGARSKLSWSRASDLNDLACLAVVGEIELASVCNGSNEQCGICALLIGVYFRNERRFTMRTSGENSDGEPKKRRRNGMLFYVLYTHTQREESDSVHCDSFRWGCEGMTSSSSSMFYIEWISQAR